MQVTLLATLQKYLTINQEYKIISTYTHSSDKIYWQKNTEKNMYHSQKDKFWLGSEEFTEQLGLSLI